MILDGTVNKTRINIEGLMSNEKIDLTVDWDATSDTPSSQSEHWSSSYGTIEEKLSSFPRYVDRTAMSRFLVKNEIFNRIRNVQGSIIECGVHFGGGLMTWANLSALHEPLNHRRRVIGFDTFEGFPSVSEHDVAGGSHQAVQGGYNGGSLEDIERGIEYFDQNRALGNIPKVSVIKGDFMKTCNQFFAENTHMVVSLLYLDFDIYEPTKHALEMILPRMPKGAIVAFDELHVEEWPGETQALHDAVGINNVHLERMPFSSICWWQL